MDPQRRAADPEVTEPTASPGWGRTEWMVLFVALAAYLATVRPLFGICADDAYITFRYAMNWAAGCGPRYNCGEPPVEGYTNFLWMALSALTLRLGLDVVSVMRYVGLACGFGALAAITVLCRRLHRSSAATLLPLIGLASSPFWAVNAVSGLETLAATGAVVLAAALSLDLPGGRQPWLAGLAWAVSYLLRPEGLGFAALTGLWSLIAGWARRCGWRRTLWGTLQMAGGFLAIAGPYFLWRLTYYGSLVPNTLVAKREPLAVLLPRNYRLLEAHWVFFAAIVLPALVVLLVRRRLQLAYLFTLALAAAGISLSVHNNFWMPGHRLYLTAVALLSAIAGGIGDGSRRRGGAPRRWVAIPLAAAIGTLLCYNWQMHPETKTLAETHYARDNHPARSMGLRLRTLARPGDWLAIRDAGMVPFHAGPMLKVLDMHDHSLNDRRIARQGWDLGYVLGRNLRFVVFASYDGRALSLAHPVEERIERHPSFAGKYQHLMTVAWNPARHFFLYQRRAEKEASRGPRVPPLFRPSASRRP